MNNQDPIADMLTRIRNANRVGRRLVMIPNSKICTGIAGVLKAGLRTADLARPGERAVGSQAMGEEIARRIEIGRMAVPAKA